MAEKPTFKPTRFMLPTSHYDKQRADRAVAFIQQLQHTTGEWAGKPFKLLRWQEQIIRDIFGVIKPDGYRQFRDAFIECGKKNGKSELAAAIALYMLCADGEQGAQIYGCANDRGQASIVFNVAQGMVERCPELFQRIKIVESQKRLVYMPTNSFYAAVSSEVATKYGLNISCCVFDELLGQQTRDFFDTMTKGAGAARKQPLNFIITTAGNDKTSICYEVHSKAVDIINGRKVDPAFYPVIYGADEQDDWTAPETWAKANPSIGVTVDIEFYRDRCESAKQNPAEEIQFRQFHLNQWTNTSVRWMPMDKWDACGVNISLDDLEGRTCYGGLDLSSTSDLTAFVLAFPPLEQGEPYIVVPFFWLPEETLTLRVRRDHVMYDVWAKQNYINTTEGNVVHYAFIQEFIRELHTRVNIKEIAYDRWNASMFVQALEDDGFTMVPFGQGYRDMSPPTKDLMRMVLSRELAHDKNPVLRWNIDNVFVSSDPAGNIKMNKEKSTEKIDGAVALVMALDRASRQTETDSVYNHRGLIVL
ncbi:MAG: terminase large subunit [Lachnospiraceae bacterium]|nr:terminase large subunit [Lachnospiraceae bacterium]